MTSKPQQLSLFDIADPGAVQSVTNCDLLPISISDLEYKGKPIRRGQLEDGTEVWVVIDVIAAVTQSKNPTDYWYRVKRRMKEEGNEISTNCRQLKIQASDGKFYAMEVMTRDQILRMLQSIPSKKAEPFKQWIAHLAGERIEEIQNPDLAVKRGYEGYLKKGMTPEKAMARAKSVVARVGLTGEWKSHGINQPKEFAMLTDRESKGIFGKITSEMKKDRDLAPCQSLRDHMTISELAAQFVGDVAISELIEKNNPYGYDENAVEVDKGSTVGARVLADLNRLLEE